LEGSQPLVQSMHHELSNMTVQGYMSWPYKASTEASMVLISLNGSYGVVKKCQVIICVQVWWRNETLTAPAK
jgi:hypothetical protein